MKKTFTIVIAILVIAGMIGTALAETATPYASRVFNSTTISINISGGKVSALARAESVYTASKLGVKSFSIQVLNGSAWVTVASTSNQYSNNTDTYSKTISCNATSGKTYRAKVTFSGTVNGVSETLSMTSSTKTAP